MSLGLSGILLKEYIKAHHNNNVRMVSRGHGFDVYSERVIGGFHPYQDSVIERFDLICPCSDDGTLYLQKKFPCYKDKILTAKLGSDDFGVKDFVDFKKRKVF